MIRLRQVLIISLFLIGSLVLTSNVRGDEVSTQQLVDGIKQVIERGERNRTSGSALLEELRGLVKLYDWPWRVRLFDDDFRDGDYQRDPTWIVDSGDFSVARGAGLRSQDKQRVDTDRRSTQGEPENPATAILGALLGASRGQPDPSSQQAAAEGSQIHTRVKISNAFAVKVQLSSSGHQAKNGQLEFGPYAADADKSGYRLAYYPGRRPAFELLRVSPGRSSVIEIYNGEISLEDNRTHLLEWQRRKDGEMVIMVDGKEILRNVDRAVQDKFDGFTVINRGGDYTFSRIALFGTEQH